MIEHTYPEGAAFPGHAAESARESQPAWPVATNAPDGAPNIVLIVLDDLGYAQLGCYGGLGGRISTPNIDALAQGGLRYRNFHATPLCSPTRAAMLSGRNAHTMGVGMIMEYATGYPGYNAMMPKDAALLPAILKENGYSTMALGKWHLAPDAEVGPWGPFDRWPLGQGFERFYGFLPGETSQWEPELWADNHRVEAPRSAQDGYHLSEDLVDVASRWITEKDVTFPSRPFFTYLALGAMHAPHHAPPEWIDRYRGAFDDGWDVIRAETLARQKELGVVPGDTQLSGHNECVANWDDLTDQQRRVYARQMEVFAGFLSHTDYQIGRLVDLLRDRGMLDNTLILVMSDNGASAEGGPDGLFHEMSYFNRSPENIDDMDARLDEWGTPSSHPHYATGWAEAGNTPNRWYKSFAHEGGTRVPFIAHWPAGIDERGTVRRQFTHVVDVTPTLLDLVGVPLPESVAGVTQREFEGASFRPTVNDADAPATRSVQYFECMGHRAVWKEGWKAVAVHRSTSFAYRIGLPPGTPLHDGDWDADRWELYRLDSDFAELDDRAEAEPDRLAELVDLWWREARKYQVLPLDDRGAERTRESRPMALEPQSTYVYDTAVMLGRSSSPDLRDRSFVVTAEIDASPDAEGVVVSFGSSSGGFSVFVENGHPHVVFSHLGRREYTIAAPDALPAGACQMRMRFERTRPNLGRVSLEIDGVDAGELEDVPTNPTMWSMLGVQVGADSVSTVSRRYAAPNAFTGTVGQVAITLGDRPDARPAGGRDSESRIAEIQQ